jgi:hypothetical protein
MISAKASGNRSTADAGYRMVVVPGGGLMPEHRTVWIRAHGPIPPGYVVHHKDGDKRNNRLSNLELLILNEHARRYTEDRMKRLGTDNKNKYCASCSRARPRACFHRSRSSMDGLGVTCRDCMNARRKQVRRMGDAAKRRRGDAASGPGNYKKIHIPGMGKWMEHRVVWTLKYGPIPPGYIVHHRDGNKRNNHPRNLELLSLNEHMRRHNAERRKRQGTDKFNKYCPHCRRAKPRAKFNRARRTWDGLRSWCADCERERLRRNRTHH